MRCISAAEWDLARMMWSHIFMRCTVAFCTCWNGHKVVSERAANASYSSQAVIQQWTVPVTLWHQVWSKWRRWWKQTVGVLLMCCFVKQYTSRLQLGSAGQCLDQHVTYSLHLFSFLRADQPNQTTSVLLGFSWRWQDAHHWATLIQQFDDRWHHIAFPQLCSWYSYVSCA